MARRNKPVESIEDRKAKRRAERAQKIMEKEEGPRPGRYYNLGGHLIDPPNDCPKKKRTEDGASWVDLALCRNCHSSKECNRYTSFIKMGPNERNDDLKSRGVKLNISWKPNA